MSYAAIRRGTSRVSLPTGFNGVTYTPIFGGRFLSTDPSTGIFRNVIAATGIRQIAHAGPEGQMPDAATVQTMRMGGGLTFPSALSGMLPLILVFAVIILIIFKK